MLSGLSDTRQQLVMARYICFRRRDMIRSFPHWNSRGAKPSSDTNMLEVWRSSAR